VAVVAALPLAALALTVTLPKRVRGNPMLFTSLAQASAAPPVRFGDEALSYRALRDVTANVAADGYVRVVGRRSTDLIKSGGFKIGAGEIEDALLGHEAVTEAAVTAEPDADLGERIVAWVVLGPQATATAEELVAHVAELLSPHKRPRAVHFLDDLPRNDMGKIRKRELTATTVGGDR